MPYNLLHRARHVRHGRLRRSIAVGRAGELMIHRRQVSGESSPCQEPLSAVSRTAGSAPRRPSNFEIEPEGAHDLHLLAKSAIGRFGFIALADMAPRISNTSRETQTAR